MGRLSGKTALVTGSTSNIGRAIAQAYAAEGAHVVVTGRDTDRGAAVVAGIRDAGGRADFVASDLDGTPEASHALAAEATRLLGGRLDVLVNNAGVALSSLFDDLRVEDWETVVDVNLKGVLYGIAAALPVFREQGSGQFVTVVSTSGLRIVPTQGVYAAAKNAVRTLCEALRQEVGPDLRVTAVSPGFTDTEFGAATPDPALREEWATRRAAIAMPPEAIARAIAFAIGEPPGVDVNEIVIRPTAQG